MSLFNLSLLAPLEQVVVMQSRIGRSAAATDGACHCFSLHWLSEILRNPGGLARDRMATISRVSGGANLILQKVFVTRWGTDGMDGADFLATQNYRLRTKNAIRYGAFNLGAVRGKLIAAVGSGFIYSFWFQGSVVGASGGAHSIAFYVNRYAREYMVHVFDPNFGEFLCTSTEFAVLMSEIFAKYGPITDHSMRSAMRW
ncbi:hypothetical protein WL35_02420 [Burkholderia ubonensis]|nr:YopT-type cysteine protease domain-containing protein [Burkholderia ubonensis]KVZ32061.1 hypothetical protein WL13_27260 [Burkholderia ubonensis]KWB18537.1 hypothetical protein WL33_06540 [Burkholderia ubonensis]KWB51773.1 hypothetical protein WL35_02420 [Burkholderia ubonensis]